jgi:hypothetical protein
MIEIMAEAVSMNSADIDSTTDFSSFSRYFEVVDACVLLLNCCSN